MMWYFGKPTSSVAAATYPCEIAGTSTSMTMMGGTYDWSAMPARPWESGTTEDQRKAIGKLVYDVGVSVGMNWGADGSGSSLYDAQTALMVDFGYAQAVALLYQDHKDYYPWSLETFKQVVVPCLDARTPVGLSIKGDGGHAVLADGYGYSDGAFCLHVNFGWGSSADTQTAWYCPPDLDTSSYSFNTINAILCNVFPDRTGNVFSGRVLDGSGNPVAGAAVSFSDGQTAVSDEHGVYAFVAPPGLYSATASKGGLSGIVCNALTETVPLETTGRDGGYSYTPNKCGNSGDNDIVLSALPIVATPVVSPASCLIYPSTNVTLACATPGATIRYTLDGTIPTESSPAYFRPVVVDDACTVAARAFADGKTPSALGVAEYAYDPAAGPPKGDLFANPFRIAGASGSRTLESTAGYTTEDGEPYHTLINNSRYNEYRTIWYRWTAPGSGRMTFRTTARTETESGYSLWHTAVAVYVGDDIRHLTRVAVNATWDTTTGDTVVELDVRRGRTYRIVGTNLYDKDMSFTLAWSGDLLISNPAVLSVQ